MTIASRLAAPLLAALLCACGESSVAPVQPDTLADPSFTGWRQENGPVLPYASLRGGWAASPGDVYLASDRDLLRWSDGRWSVAATFPRGIAGLAGVLAREVYVSDWAGVLHRWDGSRWTAHDSGLGDAIGALYATGPGQVYGTFGARTLVHFDGSRWRQEPFPDNWPSFWSPGGDDLWATGVGTVFRREGGAWRRMDLRVPVVSGLWGSGPSNVFAVGGDGMVVRWDGQSWTMMERATDRHLAGVWGRAPDDVYAVGAGGMILRYDGTRWRPMESGTRHDLGSVWGAGDAVFAAGGGATVLRLEGGRWVKLHSAPDLHDVWAASAAEAFAVGEDGTILRRRGAAWTPMESGTLVTLRSVWGRSARDLFAAGDSGVVLHYDGTRWSPMRSGTTARLNAVWGRSGGEVYAAGDAGTLLHHAGGAWRVVPTGTTAPLWRLAVPESGEVFVGGQGALLRYDGAAVSPLSPPVDVRASAFTALAVGEGGLVVGGEERISTRSSLPFLLRRQGEGWSRSQPATTYQSLHAVSPGVMVGVRSWRQVERITPAGVEALPPVPEGPPGVLGLGNGFWPVGAGEFFMVGDGTAVYHGRF